MSHNSIFIKYRSKKLYNYYDDDHDVFPTTMCNEVKLVKSLYSHKK